MTRLLSWILQHETISNNQRAVDSKTDERRRLENIALVARDAGDRTLRPVSPFRYEGQEPIASMLYSASIRATMDALDVNLSDIQDDEALRNAATGAPLDSISLERLCELIGAEGSGSSAEWRNASSYEAEALSQAAHGLLDVARLPESELQIAYRRRTCRVGLSMLTAIILVAMAGSSIRAAMLPADLARGASWRASTAYQHFDSGTGIVEGRETEIFFHTEREREPWVEVDLGAPTTVSRVDVINRRDYARDRAIPLAIEASLDAETWTELGKRASPFTKWTLQFAPMQARYIRAKALKQTFLHLEAIQVR